MIARLRKIEFFAWDRLVIVRARTKLFPCGVALAFGEICASCLFAQSIIFVNASATGTNSGASWENAYVDLQDALDEVGASQECPCEIWVAKGTYKPDRGTGDRHATFQLYNNVAMYGGFIGTESDCAQRDPSANRTILSGDLSGDDVPEPKGTSSCCEPYGCDDETCRNTVIESLPSCALAWSHGCAARAEQDCCELCRPSRCENSLHVVSAGYTDSSSVLDGFTIRGGEANIGWTDEDVVYGNFGGGILAANLEQSFVSTTINQCIIEDNAAMYASAFYHAQGEPTVTNCSFIGNRNYRPQEGVAAGFLSSSNVMYSNCLFTQNRSGAIYYNGVRGIHRCAFIDNHRMFSRILNVSGVSTTPTVIKDCLFMNNNGVIGTAINATGGYVEVFNSMFIGGQLYSNSIVRNILGSLKMTNCIFSGNANLSGGPCIENNAIISLQNCTVANNSVVGMRNYGVSTVRNCVFWGNRVRSAIEVERMQIFNYPKLGGVLNIDYCDVEGWTGAMGGTGNVDLDPLFLDADGPDDVIGTLDDNLRLSADSPLINLGHPDPPLAPYLDADGHARILCGRIDMGAYEFGIGDYNCDRVVELIDFAAFPSCLTGPAPEQPYPSACAAYDFVTEIAEDVDLLDFAKLQNTGWSE